MAWKRASAAVGLLMLAIVGCVLTAPAGATTTLSSAEIIQRLSQQREANGIPGGLSERPDWSADCAKHNYYEAQTGELAHSEDPGSLYYSPEGNWAAENSVLASGSSWSQGNPWENAPIHLIQLLAPQLSEMGAAENDDHDCATTWPGYHRPQPASLTAYSYPGNGVTGVVPAERAAESPSVPGDQVGLPEGTTTGRHLLVYLLGVAPSDASDVTVSAATLAGGAGPVDLRVVDSTNPDIGPYMPQPSAFLIPAQPLKPQTAYQADVTWSMEGSQLFEQRFGFTTGTNPGEGIVPIKKKRGSCGRYSRAAHSLRRRAARARRHGLRARARRLRRLARHESGLARRCHAGSHA